MGEVAGAAKAGAGSLGRAAKAATTKVGKKMLEGAKELPDQLHNVRQATKANKGVFNKGTMSTVKSVAKNPVVQAGVGAGLLAGAVGTGAAMGRQKQAAVNSLIEHGVDFDTAVELVEKKAQELYGE